MKIAEGIILIEGKDYSSNCYLISGAKKVLVDTGTEDNFARLTRFAKGRVDMIVNTHCHYDHVGAGALLKKEFGAEIAAHEPDAQYIMSADARYTCSSVFCRKLESVKVDVFLKDGENIPGTDFSVVHTPGHTAGSICLFDAKRKILLSGDTIFSGGCVGRTDLPGGDHDALVGSIEKISRLGAEMILPGHGEPVLSGAAEYVKSVFERESYF